MLDSLKKKATLAACLFLFICICSWLKAQPTDFTKYHNLLNGELDQEFNINSSFEAYLAVYQSALQHLLLETVTLESYEENVDHALRKFEAMEDNNPWKLFYESETRLLTGLIYLKNKRQLDAGWQIRLAFRISKENRRKFKEFLPSLKTLGFLQVALGAVPEKYHWLLSLAGLNGSVKEGFSNLDQLRVANSPFSLEASYLTALAYTYLTGNTEQGAMIISQVEHVSQLSMLVKMSLWSKNNQSHKIIKSKDVIAPTISFPQIFYLLGEAYIQKADYPKAIVHYQSFVKNSNSHSNKKDSYFKMAICSRLTHNEQQSTKFLEIAAQQEAITAADRNAKRMLDNWHEINLDILKVRLATDGGFYDSARNWVPLVQPKRPYDSVEWVYRQARLNHKTGNLQKAIAQYQQTIEKSKGENWYFAPNSALNLGYIAESKKNYSNALGYYKLARNFKKHLYKNSIESKAEAGINRLRDYQDE